jgi:hypothetical protein
MPAPFFCVLHTLAVHDAGGRTRLTLGLFTAFHIQRVMHSLQRAVPAPQAKKYPFTVLRSGRSFGMYRHWQPVLKTYITPLTTSGMLTVRLPPPRLAAGSVV